MLTAARGPCGPVGDRELDPLLASALPIAAKVELPVRPRTGPLLIEVAVVAEMTGSIASGSGAQIA